MTPDTTTFALDRRTAALLKEPNPNEWPVAFLLKLHVDLFFGLPGNVLASTAQGCILLHAIGKGVASGRISRLLAMPARPDRRAGAA